MTQGQQTRRPTRGVRNNNPGNIDRVAGTNWIGAAKDQTDPRFVVFISAEMGVRALARTLLTYFKQHKLATVRGIINRWAPPRENNTAAYIDAVCRDVGRSLGRTINADQRLDVDTVAVMRPLVVAIIAHENAGFAYPAGVIDEGLRLAGVADAKARPLLKAGEIQGILAAAPLVAVSSAEVVETLGKARDQLAPAAGLSPLVQALIVLLSLIGCGVVIWSRFARQRKTLS
ncbi:MAG: hypothetical protein P0Y50_08870 [Candidatus Brevundimonas colombiensis]|uniref:Structural protein P5 n=1 Tax=Candidatus Brevundimonas colombiensis TaxID=3121376 RepID=A0AAJ5WWB3_9CAUL|nr:hypothetical protein [Brevundimonas sp.]WEK38664.1 MAG: hypothetical protein P0Y50_08870 [Brevundimonas sp.]